MDEPIITCNCENCGHEITIHPDYLKEIDRLRRERDEARQKANTYEQLLDEVEALHDALDDGDNIGRMWDRLCPILAKRKGGK